MKYLKIFTISIIAFLATSCQTTYYQVSTLESKDVDENFRSKNKHLTLDYNFWHYGGILYFQIYNHTDSAIHIDWEHSNFIFNGLSYDYFNNTENITTLGVYKTSNVNEFIKGKYSVGNSATALIQETTVDKEKKSVQIPPKAYIEAKFINLEFPDFEPSSDKNLVDKTFDESNSILKIRVYLAYSFNKDLTDLQYVNNEIWIKNIKDYKEAEFEKQKQKNKFYTSYDINDSVKVPIVGGVLGGLGLAGLITAILLIF